MKLTKVLCQSGSLGMFCAVTQYVFLREYLTLFFGNEISIGLVLAWWLLASGIGSVAGVHSRTENAPHAMLGMVIGALSGIVAARASALLVMPGELIGPLLMITIIAVTLTPCAFLCGWLFGGLSKYSTDNPLLYSLENVGVVSGSLLSVLFIYLGVTHSIIIVIFALPMVFCFAIHRPKILLITAIVGVLFVIGDKQTSSWKYPEKMTQVASGHTGEIATQITGHDTTILVNRMLYRSTMAGPFIEQAVHAPMTIHPHPASVLVLFDRGHAAELAQYSGIVVDRLEIEPLLADHSSIITPPEQFHNPRKYDLILLGSDVPHTLSDARFFTDTFFKRLKSWMADSALVSFTFSLNSDYLSKEDRQILGSVRSTLVKTFAFSYVLPGNGLTIIAADHVFNTHIVPRVPTRYFASTVLLALTPERIADVNRPDTAIPFSSTMRPIVAGYALIQWMSMFRWSGIIAFILLGAGCITGLLLLPKKRSIYSLMTTGFSVGVYSIAIMMLFQVSYGNLYSHIALVYAALAAGCAIGSFFRRLPTGDFMIGIFILGSMYLVSLTGQPPVALLLLCQLLLGILAGAQIASLKDTALGVRNGADLIGGVLGMAFGATVLLPFFGVMPVIWGLFLGKVAIGFYADELYGE